MRREMRQLEGAWYSQAAIDRSKVRLQRLGIFQESRDRYAEGARQRRPGRSQCRGRGNLVRRVHVRPGYSQVYGIVLSISVSQNNFLGTGDRAAFTRVQERFLDQIRIVLLPAGPYPRRHRSGLRCSDSKLNQQQANLANYLKQHGSILDLSRHPGTESDTVNLQLGASKTQIFTGSTIQQVMRSPAWPVLAANGNPIFTTTYYSPQPIVDYIKALNHKHLPRMVGAGQLGARHTQPLLQSDRTDHFSSFPRKSRCPARPWNITN